MKQVKEMIYMIFLRQQYCKPQCEEEEEDEEEDKEVEEREGEEEERRRRMRERCLPQRQVVGENGRSTRN